MMMSVRTNRIEKGIDFMTTVSTEKIESSKLQSHVSVRHVTGTETQVRLAARDHTFTIDEPTELGGTDSGANPIEHLLAALGSCQAITYKVWAGKLGLRIDNIDIEVSGDIDLAGFFGTSDEARPGFKSIRVTADIVGPESRASYDELIAAVEAHCPVLDNLTATVPVTATVNVNPNKTAEVTT